ncbi:MAG TPA: TonB-dependent receptor [Steroidobacter sp.]
MSRHARPTAPALSITMGAIAAGALAPAKAQTAPENAQGAAVQSLETVVVTGSLLKRIDAEVALPVTTLGADELVKSGVTNAADALQLVAQNQFSTISNTSIGSGTGFASYASLRSLGSARTLVLVNGKRMVNNPYQSLGVDLNTVPMALIERVEVLTDGASSTYGSDAIAGVINYITRSEMNGLSVSATATKPEGRGDGETYQGSIAAGFGSLAADGWNAYAGVNWRKFETLMNVDRDFARTTYRPEHGFSRLHGTTFPANYSQPATGLTAINPFSPECNPPSSLFGAGQFGPRSCAYDFAPDIPAVPPQEQWSAIGKASFAIGEHVASIEYIRAYNELRSAISPQVLNGLQMGSNNPFFPGQGIVPGEPGLDPSLPISVNWRMTDTGNSTSEVSSTTDRILAQLEGQVLGWDYQVSALRSDSEVELDFVDGYVRIQSVRDGLAGANGAPFLNPFGEQTDEGKQFLLNNRVIGNAQRAEGELRSFGVQLSRDLIDLPAGPLAFALAAEYKEEESEFVNNFGLLRQAQGTGLELSQDIAGERDVTAFAAEANVPVLEDLELGLAVRYDKYSDFGDTVNPKVSVRYQPLEALLLRASYNTGFRAATLYDLYAPEALPISRVRAFDPVLCPNGVPNLAAGAVPTRDCNVQFNLRTSGNPDLDAEESTAYSVGFLVQPSRRWSFGADYWEYDVTKTIGVLAENAVFADPVKYADRIVRCSQTTPDRRALIPNCNIAGGDPIAFIDATTDNLGDTRASGVDITGQWTSPSTPLGTFSLSYRGTYVEKYEFQREPGGEFFSRNGEYVDGLPVIRYSHYATLRWDRGAWSARLVNRHKSGYIDCNQACVGNNPQFFRKVGSYSLWDLSGTFDSDAGVSVTVGINNVLDQDPPFTNKTSGLGSGWDERFTDPLGRTYMLLLTYEM